MTSTRQSLDQTFCTILNEILRAARGEVQPVAFLDRVSQVVLDHTRSDAVEIVVPDASGYRRASAARHQPVELIRAPADLLTLDDLCRDVRAGVLSADRRVTPRGSFWTGAAGKTVSLRRGDGGSARYWLGEHFRSMALIPFDLEQGRRGLLLLKAARPRGYTRRGVLIFENVAQLLGVTIVHRRTQLALRERVKELSCLYEIARLVSVPEASLDDIFAATADLLPPAWLHPDLASGQIEFDGKVYRSRGHVEGVAALQAEIIIEGRRRGLVEVSYREPSPPLDEGPFLREERSLIDVIAKELALIVIQRSAELERQRLQDQLRHADRLATIGQLSAGVAHELNEPLGSILGFAQLAQKDTSASEQTRRDLERIVAASLHAREVIGKLMLFARQSPPQKSWVNLNTLVRDGLYFLEARCAKSGIELKKDLDPGLAEITADTGQLYQVLINLSVNAIQAMPDGGELTIRTRGSDRTVQLVVEDNGEGMTEEVREQIFLPFFTTKDVGEGTGLGLAVADGIVRSHGGRIYVKPAQDRGTRFIVELPLGAAVEHELRETS
jgi:signal transduction histidine kinase